MDEVVQGIPLSRTRLTSLAILEVNVYLRMCPTSRADCGEYIACRNVGEGIIGRKNALFGFQLEDMRAGSRIGKDSVSILLWEVCEDIVSASLGL